MAKAKKAPQLDSGLACLAMLARFHEVPMNPDQVKHEHAVPGVHMGVVELVQAVRGIGLKARLTQLKSLQALEQLPLPAIAETKQGRFVIVAKAGAEKVLIHDPEAGSPQLLSQNEAQNLLGERLVLVGRQFLLPARIGKFDISWFIPEIIRHKRLFGEVLMGSFFLQLFALMTPLFFQVVVDKVLAHRSVNTLDVLVFGLLVLAVFESILGVLRNYLLAHTTSRVDVTLGARLYKHLLSLPLAYFEARRVGDTVARVRELETIRNFLTGSTLTALIDAVFTVVFLAVMFYYSAILGLVVVATIPLYGLLCAVVTPTLRRRVDEKFARGAENQSFLVESVSGVQTLKASAVEPQMRRRWEDQLAAYVKASFNATQLNNTASFTAQLISKVTTALILWLGAHQVMAGDMTVGQLIAFNMLVGRVTGPILRLAQLWQDFQQVGVSLERLADILNTRTEVGTGASRAQLPKLQGKITLEHVIFRYAPDTPAVLDDVSLTIRPGEVVGIVGASGSGKSTLTKLVQRLYVPERGRVLVDGVDLAMVDPTWLRRQIGVVLQENFLLNRTVRDNIALADPSMPMARVVEVAKLAGAHEFILELPQGYDTLLGERGGNLSGGQRQRIAIARALATNPSILIFDEATSALDYESEHIIQQNMRSIADGRTVIIIAHRLSTVYDANRILVMERGRIVEQGAHDDLIKQGGIYARLFRLQAGVRRVAQ